MTLVDLATLITIWILAVQYFLRHLIAPWYEDWLENKRNKTPADARRAANRVLRKAQFVILLAFMLAVILGTVGYVRGGGCC